MSDETPLTYRYPQARLRVTASYAPAPGQVDSIDVEINDPDAGCADLCDVITWLSAAASPQVFAVSGAEHILREGGKA